MVIVTYVTTTRAANKREAIRKIDDAMLGGKVLDPILIPFRAEADGVTCERTGAVRASVAEVSFDDMYSWAVLAPDFHPVGGPDFSHQRLKQLQRSMDRRSEGVQARKVITRDV